MYNSKYRIILSQEKQVMNKQKLIRTVSICVTIILIGLSSQLTAQSPSTPEKQINGDWKIKAEINGRQINSILSLSQDNKGNRTGQWISFWRLSELKAIKYENGYLSFTRKSSNRQGQTTTSKFMGTIKKDILTGTISRDSGEYKIEGKRTPRLPGVVGDWAMGYADNQVSSILAVRVNKKGKVTAEWHNTLGGDYKITNLSYEKGTLSFKLNSMDGDRRWESAYEGGIRRHINTLSGVMKVQRGDIQIDAIRIGTPLIGDWYLDLTSDRGSRKQRLKVNRDMSGLFGTIPIQKINLQDGKVTFKTVMEFGQRKFEMSFKGKLTESKLTGELKTSRGTTKVTGKKGIHLSKKRTTPESKPN